MNMDRSKWLRRIEVELIYKDASGNASVTDHYVSDGTRNGLAISFSVSKTLTGNPNESTVVISNMSPASRNKLVSNVASTAVRLYANYQSGTRTLLASGDLTRAWPEREGTENKMTLTFMDGVTAILKAVSSRSWPGNTPIKQVLYDIGQDMKIANNGELLVDMSNIHVEGVVPSRGMTTSYKSSAELDRLAKNYGFTWSIQNNIFQCYPDRSDYKEPSRRKYKISVPNQNLLKAEPELGEKFMQMIGMKITAMLDSNIRAGDIVELESTVYPQYNGKYTVSEIEFTGNTFGQEWEMVITSKSIPS